MMWSGVRRALIASVSLLLPSGCSSKDSASTQDTTAASGSSPLESYLNSLPEDSGAFKTFGSSADAVYWAAFFVNSDEATREAEDMLGTARRQDSVFKPPAKVRHGKSGQAVESSDRQEQSSTTATPQALHVLHRAQATMSPPQIDAILNRPLMLGPIRVAVIRDPSVNQVVGQATCDAKGAPIILLATASKRPINEYAFLFFREHEMAHLTKGHISCPGHRFRTGGPEQELEADCEASRVLQAFPNGLRVIDRTWANLVTLKDNHDGTHPSPKKRADNLDSSCTP